jgi:replicative superfamily II helicase
LFKLEELKQTLENSQFKADYATVLQGLAFNRVEQEFALDGAVIGRLRHFVEAVMASATQWDTQQREPIVQKAAEIAELLGASSQVHLHDKKHLRLRAALLYELAGTPSLSAAVVAEGDLDSTLDAFFRRVGPFKALRTVAVAIDRSPSNTNGDPLMLALAGDARALSDYQQGLSEGIPHVSAGDLRSIAADYQLSLNATDILAFDHVASSRARRSTRAVAPERLFEALSRIEFPAELWTGQVRAIEAGFLDEKFDAWGFAAPTGTGKTFLTRLLILNALAVHEGTKVLYVVPSKALVTEVSNDLGRALKNADLKVLGVGPQLVAPLPNEARVIDECDVAVLTPEKADLLLRLGSDFLTRVELVIIDEAHHIEAGSRGVLLELYLWRLRRVLPERARFVLLSAVAPNIRQIASWIGRHPNGFASDTRSTRMRAGVYRVKKSGKKRVGVVEYSDGTALSIVESPSSSVRTGVIEVAHAFSKVGPVLVVAKGKGECEHLAKNTRDWLEKRGALKSLSRDEVSSDAIKRLDSRLEREMYESVPMRKLLKHRIAYHHAGLPPRVRQAVESAIRENLIDYVYATTTLAEGVNFPFSTVIVESLAIREPPEKGRPARFAAVTPRTFWNIAGRAGRPGADREGQAILFEPSLGLKKVNAVIDPYLQPTLSRIQPVTSALATGIGEIADAVRRHELAISELSSYAIPERLERRVHGTVNLLRIALVQAKTSKVLGGPQAFLDSTFAWQFMTDDTKQIASELLAQQSTVVDRFLKEPGVPPVETIAEIGLSIETLSALLDYARRMTDWQIEKLKQLFYGGQVNISQAQYVLNPVAARMAELEGRKLGAFMTSIIEQWIMGVPFSAVKKSTRLRQIKRVEDLISLIYSRVQYLLPWGLYAMDRILEIEAKRRGIQYDHGVLNLAYLSDAGVPDFDALRLVNAGFERVDATRLSERYSDEGRLSSGRDVIGWIRQQELAKVQRWIRGTDSRKPDFDLRATLNNMRSGAPPQ